MRKLLKGQNKRPDFVTLDNEEGSFQLLISFKKFVIGVFLLTKDTIYDEAEHGENYWVEGHIEDIENYEYTIKVFKNKLIPVSLINLAKSQNVENNLLAGNILINMFKKELKTAIIEQYNLE